jgi:DUF3087 family protein
MKLIDINKARYRKHLNIIIISFIATFTLLSVVFGQSLIAIFSDGSGNNFRFNLAGVILGLLACAAILNQLRNHSFFYEVYYVWQLKQIINRIFRKLKSLKSAANNNDVNALIILNYYYHASLKLYLLDDNTLTLSTINKDLTKTQEKIASLNLSISSDDFTKEILTSFKTSAL